MKRQVNHGKGESNTKEEGDGLAGRRAGESP